ncbi:MAG: peptidase S41 [Desulfobacteraceae bacterium 4572_19]|nr:MAG: peptidase S41 [Desulfobacteraceae bacterium 4572_19]
MRKKTILLLNSTIVVLLILMSIVVTTGFSNETAVDSDQTYESLKLLSDVIDEIENNYVDTIETRELIHNAIKGLVSGLDPHSAFMLPKSFEELQDDTKGQFGGIGIEITMKDGILTVISPIEGTPAYKAGICAQDVIIKIDGVSTKEMPLWESVKKMRGPKGDKVNITVIRKGVPDPIEFTLVRATIPIKSVKYVTIKPGYGYVWLTNFRRNTAKDLEKALQNLASQEQPLEGVILDLRNNPGGLLDQAIKISDIFIDDGTIVSIKGRKKNNTNIFTAEPNKTKIDYPIVLLINGGSASASEIVAGALQDHKLALILGSTSFGKGSVQTVKPLKDGYGLKYTIARYYTPNGRSIQAQGIIPDIVVPYELLTEEEEKKKEHLSKMLKEKDLKNHLEAEKEITSDRKNKKTKNKKNGLKPAVLLRDSQIREALEILIGHNLLKEITN